MAGSSRKSNFVPTRTMGVEGAWCEISGYHLKRSKGDVVSIRRRVAGVRWAYLGSHVLVTGRADEREADEEDVGLGVGERTEAVVILLTGGIPKTKGDSLAIDHDICRVVIEY